MKVSGSIVSIPVFEAADAGSEVWDMLRVKTPSGTGFIPLAGTSDAAFPFVKVKTENQGVLAVHDSASIQSSYFEGFEDGDVSDWKVGNGRPAEFKTSNNYTYSGDRSLRYYHNNDSNNTSMYYELSKTYTDVSKVEFYAYVNIKGYDDFGFDVGSMGANFDRETTNTVHIGDDTGHSMNTGLWYRFTFTNINFGNTADYEMAYAGGSTIDTGSLNIGSGIGRLRAWHASYSTNFESDFYIDDILIE
jgi:hypothetical protein